MFTKRSVGLVLSGFVSSTSCFLLAGCATSANPSTGGPLSNGARTEADRERIRQVIKSHDRESISCYERAIDARPGAEGKLLMNFEIDAKGDARNVKVAQIDPKLVDIKECIVGVFEKMKFPPTQVGQTIEINYPLYFDERAGAKFNERAGSYFPPNRPKPTPTQAK